MAYIDDRAILTRPCKRLKRLFVNETFLGGAGRVLESLEIIYWFDWDAFELCKVSTRLLRVNLPTIWNSLRKYIRIWEYLAPIWHYRCDMPRRVLWYASKVNGSVGSCFLFHPISEPTILHNLKGYGSTGWVGGSFCFPNYNSSLFVGVMCLK